MFILSSYSTIIPLSPLDSSKNLRSISISHTRHSQFKIQRDFDDEPCGPTVISPQVGPPTRHELDPGHASLNGLNFDREALRLRAPAYSLCS